MQVFIPYSEPIKVAQCLDRQRLWKQIIECRQIINAIDGAKGWRNHPIVKMYRPHRYWLELYLCTLTLYYKGEIIAAQQSSNISRLVKPPFVANFLCNHHKSRLFTKSAALYPQFAHFGKSYENWYVVEGELLIYKTKGVRSKKL